MSEASIGMAVRVARRAAELSQPAVASSMRKLGFPNFHPTTIQRIEAGSRNLRLQEAFAIAAVLGVDLAFLVGAESTPGAVDSASYAAGYRRALIDASNSIDLLKEQA